MIRELENTIRHLKVFRGMSSPPKDSQSFFFYIIVIVFYFSLAGLTIATLALCCVCGSPAREKRFVLGLFYEVNEQYSSQWKEVKS